MAAYPTLRIDYGAGAKKELGRQNDIATNGALRGRLFFAVEKKTFSFTHPGLNSTEKTTFDDFYNAEKANSFTFAHPRTGLSYTCAFLEEPAEKDAGPGLVDVQVTIREV